MRSSHSPCHRNLRLESGSILIVALILLGLLTVMTFTAFRLDKGNLQIVGNAQQKNQNLSAAQEAIEQTISRPQFAATPSDAVPSPCKGVSNTTCTDVNGDGVTDVTVAVTPTCISSQVIPSSALDLTNAEDKGCTVGVNQDFGTVGVSQGSSLCANLLWDIKAVAKDDQTGAQLVANQGVALRTVASQQCP